MARMVAPAFRRYDVGRTSGQVSYAANSDFVRRRIER